MARTAEDCALLLSAICGPDPGPRLHLARRAGRGLHALAGRLDRGPAHRRAEGVLRRRAGRRRARRDRRRAQANTRSWARSWWRSRCRAPSCRSPCTTSSRRPKPRRNLSRFDGVKFGHRAKQYGDLLDMYKKTRAEGFGDEVKRRIMIGTYVLSHGYYDAYYLQAQKIRRMIADDFQQAFKQCDVIAGPGGAHRGVEARRARRRSAGRLPGRHLHACPDRWPACRA